MIGKSPGGCREVGAAVVGVQFPIVLWCEVVDFALALNYQCEGRGLYSPHAQYVSVASAITQRIQMCGVHPQKPVAYCARKSGQIKVVEFFRRFERLEAFAYAFVSKGRNPKTFHGAFDVGFLHYPPLDEFSFLSGITAVDYLVGSFYQAFYYCKLAFVAVDVDELYPEFIGHHRQSAQSPRLPQGAVVVWLFQAAKVAECPGDTPVSAFEVAVAALRSSEYGCDVACHTGFLGYTDLHSILGSLRPAMPLPFRQETYLSRSALVRLP